MAVRDPSRLRTVVSSGDIHDWTDVGRQSGLKPPFSLKSGQRPTDEIKVVTGRLRLTAMGHVVLLIAAGTVALASSTAQDWQPIELVFLLLVLAIGSDALTIDFRGIRISGSF